MNEKIDIHDFSKHLFWDVDMADFDLNSYPGFMVQRVLEYGLWQDWQLLKKFYGLDTIKNVSLSLRSLDKVSLSFISTLFNIDKSEFQCYRHEQWSPNSWNY